MIVDSSALLAVIFDEPDARRFTDCIAEVSPCRLPAPIWLEATIVVEGRGGALASRRFEDFLAEGRIEIVPFTPEHERIAHQAWRLFGKGRHRAALNFGDCMAYAVARQYREPLLFKGDDFIHTDIEPALKD